MLICRNQMQNSINLDAKSYMSDASQGLHNFQSQSYMSHASQGLHNFQSQICTREIKEKLFV